MYLIGGGLVILYTFIISVGCAIFELTQGFVSNLLSTNQLKAPIYW